jgi:hypothetical protein
MTPEVREALEQLRQAFIAKHGREPGPDDLLFPDMPHPEHLEAMMVEDMKAAGLDPAFIYAFEKTGFLVTEQNQHLIPESDLAEWDAAIEEYEGKSAKGSAILRYPSRWAAGRWGGSPPAPMVTSPGCAAILRVQGR